MQKLQHFELTETRRIAKNTIYTLSKDDFIFCEECAINKMSVKDLAGLSNDNYGFKGTPLEKETMAIASELCFSRLLFLDDFTVSDAANNNWCDFWINEFTYDIKSTRYQQANLYLPVEKAFGLHADILCLIIQLDNFNYRFAGCIAAKDLIDENNIRRFKSVVYAADQSMLSDLNIEKELI